MADSDFRVGPVPVEALKFLRDKGIRPGWSYEDVWASEHQVSFTAAKVMREDVLRTLQTSLAQSVEGGTTFEKWKKSIKPTLIEQGWWEEQDVFDPISGKTTKVNPPHRLRTIYETNVRSARAEAQYERIQRTKKSRPYLMYLVGPSRVHREQHVAWHGTILPVDHPWWESHTPQNGYGCKCHIRQLSERERDRIIKKGVPTPTREQITVDGVPTGRVKNTRQDPRLEAPPVKLVPWRNKRTGETGLAPEGVHPSFNYRPGEGRKRALGL